MSGGKINLVLGSHAHVPIGAAEQDFENAYEGILRPFISTLCRYPKIQAVLHYSGTLLHWVERSRLELFMLIEELVSRKQVELLGGGFYEPMLPLIPPQDRIGQIELLTTYLRRHFGKRPMGCWLPAFAWEQHLVSPLAASGMAYTFLGEKQFRLAGLEDRELFVPRISEDQGKHIIVFPVSQSVEAALAEQNISLILENLKSRLPAGGNRILSIFPRQPGAVGEEAPDYTWNRFFEELSLSESIVECVTPGKLLKGLGILKKADFPDSTGGSTGGNLAGRVTPRRFIIEHPEANGIYAKMIFTSTLINQLRGDKSRKINAREELWKAQVTDLFYAPECSVAAVSTASSPQNKRVVCCPLLRKAAYRSLIEAERICREKGKFSPSLVPFDFDFDGVDEYLFQDTRINCYIQPAGAGIFELDYLPKTWNYLDTGAATETGREPRRSTAFADWLLPVGTEAEELPEDLSGKPGARLCFTEQYQATTPIRSKSRLCFILPALSGSNRENTIVPLGNIEIQKCFSVKKDVVTVDYSLSNRGGEHVIFRFVPEIRLSFAGEGEAFIRFFTCKAGTDPASGAMETAPIDGGRGFFSGADGIKIQDLKNEVQIIFASAKAFDGRLDQVRMDGYYQSSRLLPLFELSLSSGETWANEFTLKFSH